MKAIAVEAYLKIICEDGHNKVVFAMGKAKLGQVPEFNIPWLELSRTFYTDSKVVLGYINKQNKRFMYMQTIVYRESSSLPYKTNGDMSWQSTIPLIMVLGL